jgi:hypothetical protein
MKAISKSAAIKKLKKQFNRKAVKKELVKVFNQYIRERDKNRCFVCGTTANPTCGHLITCANESTQFDELNCHCQCRNCNFSHEYRPEAYTLKFISVYGAERYENLVIRSRQKSGMKTADLKILLDFYRQKLLSPLDK